MRIIIRLLGAIWIVTLVLTAGFTYTQARAERQRLIEDLARRGTLLGDGLKEAVEPALRRGSVAGIARVLKKFATAQRRLVVYDALGNIIAAAPAEAVPAIPDVSEALSRDTTIRGLRGPEHARTYVYVVVLQHDGRPLGALAVLLDAAHVDAMDNALWQSNSVRFAALASALSLVTLLVVRASVTRPLTAMADWARTLRGGVAAPPPTAADASLFGPLAIEMTGLARTLYRAQAAAAAEASLRMRGESIWTEERLLGMLGADVIGFHTQYHCNNFLETVDRSLEARIDAEHFAVLRGRNRTLVKPFPISISPWEGEEVRVSRRELLGALGIEAEFLGVGVERVDYTKGLPERFAALRRFFERHPEYRERVVFVQLAVPSRSRIERYRQHQAEVAAAAAAVNEDLRTSRWKPIVYLERHHDRPQIQPLYRYADFCMVTSLHDGMNLVAKEFVGARTDGDGVLILSRLTGASHELRDAILVNPYDVEATAEAIRVALEMPEAERRARMDRMHAWVCEHNVYQWAGHLIDELARVPDTTRAAAR